MMEQDTKQQAVGEMVAGAAAPQMAPAPDDGQVDDRVIALALETGAEMLRYIANGDLDGWNAFVDEVRKQIVRQRNLMRLLEMEQRDLDRLLEMISRNGDALEQIIAAVEQRIAAGDSASKRPAPSEVREVYSPADSTAGNGRPKTGDLHAYLGISRK